MVSNIPDITPGDPYKLQIKKRAAAVACEAIAAALGRQCDGYPYEYQHQSSTPYVVCNSVRRDYSQERGTSQAYEEDYLLELHIVVGYATEGFSGEWEAIADAIDDPLSAAFWCQPKGMQLKSDQFPTQLIGLRGFGVEPVSMIGPLALGAGTGGTQQMGLILSLNIQLEKDVGGIIDDAST